MNLNFDKLHPWHAALASLSLKIDATRGKPPEEAVALANEMLRITATHSRDGIDCRNYGGPAEGLPEMRELFGDLLGVPAKNVWAGGNASLRLMYETVMMMRSEMPSGTQPIMLCPVPGYDRHHDICEERGIKMIPVPLTDEGPDLGVVRMLLEEHGDAVIGMWIIPMYSNPTGIVYSEQVCRELVSMEAPEHFRMLCDMAYTVHHLTETPRRLPSMLQLCAQAGNPNRVITFASMSKMTFASAGVCALAASEENLTRFKKWVKVETIGPDKLRQLHHYLFFGGAVQSVFDHMAKHRRILVPRFEALIASLKEHFGESGIAHWTEPEGGYFITLKVPEGCAGRVIELAGEAGANVTPKGSMHPYRLDPNDEFIRLAPTCLSPDQNRRLGEIMAVSTMLAYLEQQQAA